jgi:hypothetical protein
MSAFPVLTGEGEEQEHGHRRHVRRGRRRGHIPRVLPDIMKQMFAGIQMGSVLESWSQRLRP